MAPVGGDKTWKGWTMAELAQSCSDPRVELPYFLTTEDLARLLRYDVDGHRESALASVATPPDAG